MRPGGIVEHPVCFLVAKILLWTKKRGHFDPKTHRRARELLIKIWSNMSKKLTNVDFFNWRWTKQSGISGYWTRCVGMESPPVSPLTCIQWIKTQGKMNIKYPYKRPCRRHHHPNGISNKLTHTKTFASPAQMLVIEVAFRFFPSRWKFPSQIPASGAVSISIHTRRKHRHGTIL